MNKYIKQSTWLALALFGWLVMVLPAQAASFDCAKASTKVEKLICGDAALSKLDEELNVAYKAALRDEKQAEAIRQSQKQWMKEQNGCSDAGCVKTAYQNRISKLTVTPSVAGVLAQVRAMPQVAQQKIARDSSVNKVSYELVMSKNDEMCNHMRQLMNDDLKKVDRTYDRHDVFVNGPEEFNSIPWEHARASSDNGGQIHYVDVEGALFDLNNDGVLDFVVRNKSMLSGMRADGLYMLDRNVASRANALTTKELFESKNQIDIAGYGYPLSLPSLSRQFGMLWLLSPFIYHGVSYLYMQSLYKNDEAIGGDYVVIAKYIGGKFVMREMTGKMEDICYIERVDVK